MSQNGGSGGDGGSFYLGTSPSYLQLSDEVEIEEAPVAPKFTDLYRRRATVPSNDENEHRKSVQWLPMANRYLDHFPTQRHLHRPLSKNKKKFHSSEINTTKSANENQPRKSNNQSELKKGDDSPQNHLLSPPSSNAVTPESRRRISALVALSSATGPGLRVKALLNSQSEVVAHPIFTELKKFANGQWKQIARWAKFEENVEACGNRWSKPHISSLSLHSLFELRHCLIKDVIELDLQATCLDGIIEYTITQLLRQGLVNVEQSQLVRETLKAGQGQCSSRTGSARSSKQKLAARNSLVEKVGRRRISVMTLLQKPPAMTNTSMLPSPPENRKSLGIRLSNSSISHSDETSIIVEDEPSSASSVGSPMRISLKRSTSDFEMAIVCIAEVTFLDRPVSAFLRLREPLIAPGEDTLPVRFWFIILGPPVEQDDYYTEIGRSVGTLFSDEVFHEVAYKARDICDFLDGVDEFLDQVTVLPPSEWDPNIRIEPPLNLPPQQRRRTSAPAGDRNLLCTTKLSPYASMEKMNLGSNSEPLRSPMAILPRTGRPFGNLTEDLKRKWPIYVSDFADGLNAETLGSALLMYFLLLTQAVSTGTILSEGTNGKMGQTETVVAAAFGGVCYSLFSGQPLVLLSVNWNVIAFDILLYSICRWDGTQIKKGPEKGGSFLISISGTNYGIVRMCSGIWTCIVLLLLLCFELHTVLARFVTTFSREIFSLSATVLMAYVTLKQVYATAIATRRVVLYPVGANRTCQCVFGDVPKSIIQSSDHFNRSINQSILMHQYSVSRKSYSVSPDKAVNLNRCQENGGSLAGNSCYELWDVALMCLVLFTVTFILNVLLRQFKHTNYVPKWARGAFDSFTVLAAIAMLSSVDWFFHIATPKLTDAEKLTLISATPALNYQKLWSQFIEQWWIVLLAIFAAIFLVVLLLVEQTMAALIVNSGQSLKKGVGYHLDIFVLALLTAFCGVAQLPFLSASTVLSIAHIDSVRTGTDDSYREQRLTSLCSAILLAVSFFMVVVLEKMPMPVMYGLLLHVALLSTEELQLVDRVLLFFTPMKYQPDVDYVRHVRVIRVHFFTVVQLCGVAATMFLMTLTNVTAIIVYPLLVIGFLGIRWLLGSYVFTRDELQYLDDELQKTSFKHSQKKAPKQEDEEMPFIRSALHLMVPLPSGNVMKIAYSPAERSKRLSQYNTDLPEKRVL